MEKFWNTDHLVVVKELYAPVIGRCQLVHSSANLEEDLSVIDTALNVLNRERKDEKGIRFDIKQAYAVIDFEKKLCKIRYKLFWIGGLIEEKEHSFPITWKMEKWVDHPIDEVTVWEAKQ